MKFGLGFFVILHSVSLTCDAFSFLFDPQKSFLSGSMLKERMEYETLEEIKVIQSKLTFSQKYVRLKTKLL